MTRPMDQHRSAATLSYKNNTKYSLNHYQHYHFVTNHFQSSVQSQPGKNTIAAVEGLDSINTLLISHLVQFRYTHREAKLSKARPKPRNSSANPLAKQQQTDKHRINKTSKIKATTSYTITRRQKYMQLRYQGDRPS